MPPAPLSLVHVTRPPLISTASAPPLLLLLHGVGSNEQDLLSLASFLDERFFVISVRAPLTLRPGAYGWYEIDWRPEGPAANPVQLEQSRQTLLRFLEEAPIAFGTDPKRTFLMGFSQGAIMSLSIALTQPEKIAGLVAMSGRLPELSVPQAASKALSGLPIFVAHGIYDNVLPIAYGHLIRDTLADLSVDLTYREYPMAHQITPESLADISAWLTEHL